MKVHLDLLTELENIIYQHYGYMVFNHLKVKTMFLLLKNKPLTYHTMDTLKTGSNEGFLKAIAGNGEVRGI